MTDMYIQTTDENGRTQFIVDEELLGGMRTYRSMAEVQRDLAKAEQAVAPLVTKEQRSITWGDQCIRFFPYEDRWLSIFIDIPTMEELQQNEDKDTILRLAHMHERGHLWGRCYSDIELGGEWGSTHQVFVAAKLPRMDFLTAMQHGWNFEKMWRWDFPWVTRLGDRHDEFAARLVAAYNALRSVR